MKRAIIKTEQERKTACIDHVLCQLENMKRELKNAKNSNDYNAKMYQFLQWETMYDLLTMSVPFNK